MYYLGIDIGGTKIEVVLFQKQESSEKEGYLVESLTDQPFRLKAIHSVRVPSERHLGYDQILEKLVSKSLEVIKKGNVSLKDIAGIGVGLPGAVDPAKKTMVMGNTIAFVEKDVCKDLAHNLQYSGDIFCENDANCFALAEAVCGAGQIHKEQKGVPIAEQVAVGVILGTGVGGGLVANGRVIKGASGGAGEIGHTILHSGGHPCYCGRDGCAEQYLSGPALEAAFVTRLYSQIEHRPKAQEIFQKLVPANDPAAIGVVKKYKRDLAKFIGNISVVLDPHYFVFGGGVSKQAYIYEGLRALVPAHLFVPGKGPRIYQHQIGDSAGVLGAALLCFGPK
jgi:predicted NBD/HSP70 family sugar kinase